VSLVKSSSDRIRGSGRVHDGIRNAIGLMMLPFARKYGRYDRRDAAVILAAYRHGLGSHRYATNGTRSSFPRGACMSVA
jgi:hypothetical protein